MRHLKQSYSAFIFILTLFTVLTLNSFSQATQTSPAPFILYGKIVLNNKPVENVSLELLKDGKLLKKIVTTKNGKYSFEMNQDTVNRKNEYVIHISKDSTVPKTLVVNTYIPGSEYDDNKYDYVLEITLVPTKVNDIVVQRPSGKIKWNESENNFGIDQVYAKIIQKEEEKLKEDPDKYLKELAELMKKEEEEKKKKEEEEAKQKAALAAEEEKKMAEELTRKNKEEEDARSKADAELTLKEQLSAIKTELKELSKVNDSLPQRTANTEKVQQVIAADDGLKAETYNQSEVYVLKKERIALEKRRQNEQKKKNANLAVKYETNNAMSSLLDAVDEHDKRMKNK